eukprot:6198118-Pleurochrysis_carterae.AAC.3
MRCASAPLPDPQHNVAHPMGIKKSPAQLSAVAPLVPHRPLPPPPRRSGACCPVSRRNWGRAERKASRRGAIASSTCARARAPHALRVERLRAMWIGCLGSTLASVCNTELILSELEQSFGKSLHPVVNSRVLFSGSASSTRH